MRALLVLLALAAGLLSAVAIAWADGEPDTTFAGDGSAEIGLGTFRNVDRPAVDVTPGGGLVAAIVSRRSGGFCQECSFERGSRAPAEGLQLVRLNADGTPYTGTAGDGWDGEGTAIFEQFAGQREVEALRVRPDGTILVVIDNGAGIELIRIKPDGTLDTTLDEDGSNFAWYGCGEGGAILEKVFISATGDRIDTVAGCSGQGALRAFDGSLNPLPGREEAIVVQNGRGFYVRDAAKDGEGRIVILGWGLDDNEHPTPDDDKVLLLRYWPDGSRDTTLAVDVPGDGLSLAVDLEDRPIVSLATGHGATTSSASPRQVRSTRATGTAASAASRTRTSWTCRPRTASRRTCRTCSSNPTASSSPSPEPATTSAWRSSGSCPTGSPTRRSTATAS